MFSLIIENMSRCTVQLLIFWLSVPLLLPLMFCCKKKEKNTDKKKGDKKSDDKSGSDDKSNQKKGQKADKPKQSTETATGSGTPAPRRVSEPKKDNDRYKNIQEGVVKPANDEQYKSLQGIKSDWENEGSASKSKSASRSV